MVDVDTYLLDTMKNFVQQGPEVDITFYVNRIVCYFNICKEHPNSSINHEFKGKKFDYMRELAKTELKGKKFPESSEKKIKK